MPPQAETVTIGHIEDETLVEIPKTDPSNSRWLVTRLLLRRLGTA